jgi:O-antigen ligase
MACLAVLPVSLLAHRYDLHNASWLQNSMRHRVVIWNYTAEEALKSPFVGIGAYMTYVLGPAYNKDTAQEEAGFHVKVSRHAHNVFLQTWFELGAIGALLLAICGLAVISTIGMQREAAQPFALATFASAMTMMAASYGIWQAWYLALFGMVAVACAIGSSVYLGSKEREKAPLLPLRPPAS